MFFFFKQKTAYEMRISDWSSDVCSSDLERGRVHLGEPPRPGEASTFPRPGRRLPLHDQRRDCDAGPAHRRRRLHGAARAVPEPALARVETSPATVGPGQGRALGTLRPPPANTARAIQSDDQTAGTP